MTPDSASPLSPQWWWASVVVPVGFGIKWLVSVGRDGAAGTISGQAQLLRTLQETVATQVERLDDQANRLDRLIAEGDVRRDEVSGLRDRIRRLESQLLAAGIPPVA